MRLNSKVTMGLAWTGLALVLAVPSADYLTSAFGGGGKAAVLTSDIEQAVTTKVPAAKPAPDKAEIKPVETAAIAPTVTTTKTPNGVIITPAGSSLPKDPVDKYLESGKALPDYISDSSTATAPAKAPTLPAASKPAAAETQVASIDPKVAPTPFPAWARPAALPAPVAPAIVATEPEPVVIVDDSTQTGSIAVPSTGPVPPSPIVDDSQNWDNESLRDYLERRGILEGGEERSTATVTQRSTDYDPDGFYLSDGPNNETREERRRRILRMLEEDGETVTFDLF